MNLLAVFAHPDDESFICGGALAKAAAEGHGVHLVCATRGEEGEIVHPGIDPDLHPKGEARGRLRLGELERACAALGIRPPLWLGHHDSGFPVEVGRRNPRALMNQEVTAIERQLLPVIGDLKPEVMITFDPHGLYPHVDHVTIRRAAEAAFWSAGSVAQPAPRRLYYPVYPLESVRRTRGDPGATMSDVDADLFGVSADSVAAAVDISGQRERKLAAICAHASQFGTGEQVRAQVEKRPHMMEVEHYALGGLRGSFPPMPVDCLFAGLEGC